MPSIFIGSTEIVDVGKIKVGSTDVLEIYVGATKIWPSGAPVLPTVFEWNAEADEALPVTASFSRGSVAFYRNDSGVWVEAASDELRLHNVTAGGGGKGWLPESAATKLALFPRDFTNAVWIATNVTPAKDATGIDGVSNSASTLTATAANGTILQSFTRGSSAHTFSVFVARKTGTGTIEITIDGGTTWVDITSSISSDIKDDPYIVTQTLANPSIGFRIVTSGDEIEVDMGDLEATDFASTPLDHTSSTANRSADNLNDATWPAETSALIDVTVASAIPSGETCPFGLGGGNRAIVQSLNWNVFAGPDPKVTPSTSYLGERHKFAFSMSVADSEGIVVDDEDNDNTNAGSAGQTGELIIIGRNSVGASYFRGVMHNIVIYSVAQTVEQLKQLTS